MSIRSTSRLQAWTGGVGKIAARARWERGGLAPVSEDPVAKARAFAYLFGLGGLLVLLTVPLARPEADFELGLVAAALAACAAAVLILRGLERIPRSLFSALPTLGFILITICVLSGGGVLGAAYAVLYLGVVVAAFSLLNLRAGLLSLAAAAAGYGAALLLSEGGTEVTLRWLIAVGALTVAGLLIAALRDRTEHLLGALRRHGGQQDVVAEIGRRALAGAEPGQLARWAARSAADGLGADHAGVFQFAAGEDAMVLRAGVGWNPEVGERARIRPDAPLLGAALLRTGAVIDNDLGPEGGERRRSIPHRHGAPASGCRRLPPNGGGASGIAVAIRGGESPAGVLAAYSCRGQRFEPSDAAFMQAVANVLADAERRREAELLARRQGLLDPLTGRPNRTLFMDRLEEAMLRARAHNTDLAVLALDIDDLETINEASGSAVGDALLRALPARIRGSLTMTDTVARIGGDEFAVLCEEPRGCENAAEVAESILRSLGEPIEVGAEHYRLSACIGIAHFDGGEEDPDELLRLAEAALATARARGPGISELFDPGSRNRVLTRDRIQRALRGAAGGDELSLALQPIYYLPGRLPHSTEALLRWHSPELGQVPPRELIAAAEQSGAIAEIDAWVLEQASRLAASWRLDDEARRLLPVNVNVASRQLAQPGFAAMVAEQLGRASASPRDLGLEITEAALEDDYDGAAATLGELRAMGVKVLLDNFGTASSSLTHLRRLPIDAVKIDRSFVAGAATEPRDGAIINAIASLASSFQIEVIGLGVETAEQVEALRGHGCLLGQGHYLAEPAPAESHFDSAPAPGSSE